MNKCLSFVPYGTIQSLLFHISTDIYSLWETFKQFLSIFKPLYIAMTTKELKGKVIGRINETNDDEVLTDVCIILDDSYEETEIYQLSENHKAAITLGINQIKLGKYLTNEQANKEADEWLNK